MSYFGSADLYLLRVEVFTLHDAFLITEKDTLRFCHTGTTDPWVHTLASMYWD